MASVQINHYDDFCPRDHDWKQFKHFIIPFSGVIILIIKVISLIK